MPRSVMKRETLEDAAITLFATKGLARTTIKDIATAAGVTEGALYRHYSGKEEMAWKLFNRELDQFIKLVSEILFDLRMNFRFRLSLAVQTMYDYYQYNADKFAFILLTQHGFPEDRLISRETDPIGMAVQFIGQAIGEGEIPPCDADLYGAMLMGILMEPLVLHRYGKIEFTAETPQVVTEACLRMFGAA